VMSRVPVRSNVIANTPASLSRLPGCGLVSVVYGGGNRV
jgi:hypothetical protein